jgi:hypothetical protein
MLQHNIPAAVMLEHNLHPTPVEQEADYSPTAIVAEQARSKYRRGVLQ